jgi:hypothetical protein
MQFKIERFTNMPYTGKVGSTLWIVSWIWMISTYYFLTHDTHWVVRSSIAAAILGLLLFQAQNWARWISVMANLMGILLSINFFKAGFTLFATVDVILFGGAIAFLMAPATSEFFKSQSHGKTPGGEQRS